MKPIFAEGATKTFSKIVTQADIAEFENGIVHAVYATFALARDAEWSGRLFVLEMKEQHEEGIGTFVHVEHRAPAFVGETVVFTAIVEKIERNEIICNFTAKVENRIIATGKTGQKIMDANKLKSIFDTLKSHEH